MKFPNQKSALATNNSKTASLSLVVVVIAFIVVCFTSQLISANLEPSSPGQSNSAGDESANGQPSFAPKRQYFIAPRVGRAGGTMGGPAAIWSALEEAALMSPGQIQPHRGFPGPLRSSLLYLVGNRRPNRASGLLPQARIGRRAAPSGLLPQPRVGRRSDGSSAPVDYSDGDGEVASASISDNSALSDAIESLMEVVEHHVHELEEVEADQEEEADEGRLITWARKRTTVLQINHKLAVTVVGAANNARDANEATIERPANRAATSFVPRLGKRADQQLGGMLCNSAIECNRLALIGALVRDVASDSAAALQQRAMLHEDLLAAARADQLYGNNDYSAVQQQLRREIRAPDMIDQAVGTVLDGPAVSNYGSKRVAFTPRIGRRR